MQKVKNLVLGGGPAGYCAAIKLGQLKQECLVVEKTRMGGTCLNVGCIPSKALIHAAAEYQKISQEFPKIGISIASPSIDWQKTIQWKDKLVHKITQGVEFLLKKNQVKILYGTGELLDKNLVKVKTLDNKEEEIQAENIILATGSSVIELPQFPLDHKKIIDSTDLLALEKLPKSIIILGGGIIGCELGGVYAALGVEVSIVEMESRILTAFEKEATSIIEKKLTAQGVKFLTSTKALKYKTEDAKIQLEIERDSKKETILAEILALSVGRKPNVEMLNLAKLGIQQEKNRIVINDQFQTNIPNIYAIGDLVDGHMLAHKASAEAVMAAEVIAGKKVSRADIKTIPNVLYTKPEIASVGMDEETAAKNNIETITGKFPLSALGRSATVNESQGYLKYIACKESHRIIGAIIVANIASELIGQSALAIEMGATLEDIALTIQAHPSFSEAHLESAAAALGEAIHIVNL